MAEQPHDDFRRIKPPLEGELVRLRAREEEDLPRINELFNDPDVTYFLSRDTFPHAVTRTREWWEATRSSPDTQQFVIETVPGELVGVCGLEGIDGRSRWATLGIWIGRPYWDRGYGTDAVRTLCRFGFREMNLQRIELRVHDSNPRGRRAYAKIGFREEGRLRRELFVDGGYVDIIMMGLLAEELVEA
jgi:RimJ/RimL family protein N-acetyltransferase